MLKKALECQFSIFTSDVTLRTYLDPNGGFTLTNSVFCARILILILLSLATLKVLSMLKLISGILKKLRGKISEGKAFGGIVEPHRFSSLLEVIQKKMATLEMLVKMKTLVACSLQIGRFCFSIQLMVYKGFCIY